MNHTSHYLCYVNQRARFRRTLYLHYYFPLTYLGVQPYIAIATAGVSSSR